MNILLIMLWVFNIVGYTIGFMTPNVASSIIMAVCLLIYAVKGIGE